MLKNPKKGDIFYRSQVERPEQGVRSFEIIKVWDTGLLSVSYGTIDPKEEGNFDTWEEAVVYLIDTLTWKLKWLRELRSVEEKALQIMIDGFEMCRLERVESSDFEEGLYV